MNNVKVIIAYIPHLAAYESQSLEIRIRRIRNSQGMRAAWIIGFSVEFSVPDIAISIESSIAVTIDCDLISADDPRS